MENQGHISKAGDPMLRTAPLRGRQQSPGKGRAALRPAALGQGAGPGQGPERARVAVARKLAILLHRLWLSDTSFQ
jgi:hypothetical protein